MKRICFFALLLLGTVSLHAATGDTSVIVSHIETRLSWFESYDTLTAFPDGSLSYRKIIMEFELGKYACEGYNPNNPGEGANQTGWCGDWDYDVHVLACTPGGDTFELGRLITPYANSNWPRTPLSWKHAYLFDVTDYYPVLKDDITIRIFYAGWSGGFTGTVKFHFIEGTPPRNVVKIDQLWRGSFSYGNTADPIENSIAAKHLTMPDNASSAAMKVIITGHGGDSKENCAEFCRKWYKYIVNGNVVEQKDIWRDDCGSNFLYPQSGTWVYDRANWCPGDLVHVNTHQLPASITAGQTFMTDLDFQSYTHSQNAASYKVSAAMFYYGDFNHQLDAGIEEIISPNMEEQYYRSNPVCGEARVSVRNFGSADIKNMKFEYGIAGSDLSTYTWAGDLASLETVEVLLPSINGLNEVTGKGVFVVNLTAVNGQSDGDHANNTLRSEFMAAPNWEGGNFTVDFKMSGATGNHVNWTITDMAGNVLFERKGTEASQRYLDTIHLVNGCYRLDVDASRLGYGLNFGNAFSKGYVRVHNLLNGGRIALPKTDLSNAALEGNFGNGFSQYFTVVNSTPLDIRTVDPGLKVAVYPNPANDYIQVDISGRDLQELQVRMTNVLGQEVYYEKASGKSVRIGTSGFPAGMYHLIISGGNGQNTQKILLRK